MNISDSSNERSAFGIMNRWWRNSEQEQLWRQNYTPMIFCKNNTFMQYNYTTMKPIELQFNKQFWTVESFLQYETCSNATYSDFLSYKSSSVKVKSSIYWKNK